MDGESAMASFFFFFFLKANTPIPMETGNPNTYTSFAESCSNKGY